MSVSDLPNEILERVLQELPTQDLLNCRLVSAQWLEIANLSCSRRFISLDMNWEPRNKSKLKALYQTFGHCTTVPWSSCKLLRWKKGLHQSDAACDAFSTAQATKFTSTFGSFIRKLITGGNNYPAILNLLGSVPNAIDLTIYDLEAERSPKSALKLSLPKLKCLEIDLIDAEHIGMLEILVRGASLDRIHLDVYSYYGAPLYSHYSRLASLLVGIPSVSLSFKQYQLTLDYLSSFIGLHLAVKSLELYPPTRDSTPEAYSPLKNFLSDVSSHLEKLVVRRPMNFKPLNLTFPTLPALPILKHLQINVSICGTTLAHIFGRLERLEILDVCPNLLETDDLNVLLSGVAEDDSHSDINVNSSILNLKRLKSLSMQVSFRGDQQELTERTAKASLLKINPLGYFNISGCHISTSVRELLAVYHK